MAVRSSGALPLTEIQTEFGGSNPVGMSEYYGDGDYVADGTTDGDGNAIPESGALDVSDFYDTASAVALTISSNTSDVNIGTLLTNASGNKTNDDVALTINNGVTVSGSDASTPAMTTGTGWGSGRTITIVNNGSIVGSAGSDTSANPGSGGGKGGASPQLSQNGGAGAAEPCRETQRLFSIARRGSHSG